MIKAADLLFRAPQADKPTILLLIDRNELEDQMRKNLAALGLGNLEHAGNIARLKRLLKDDYRGYCRGGICGYNAAQPNPPNRRHARRQKPRPTRR